MSRPSHTRLLLALVALPALACAQGGNLGEGASTGSLLQVLLGLVVGLGLGIAIGLLLVRPDSAPPKPLTGPVMIGLGLSIPILALAVFALYWTESLIAGAVVALGMAAAYVAFIARRWRR